MCSLFRISNSKVKFRERRLLIAKLILPFWLLCSVAGICGSSLLKANVSELNNTYIHLCSALIVFAFKKGVSQWGSTPLKECNFRKLHITAYHQKDDRVFRHSEITELSVCGFRHVAQHYFSNFLQDIFTLLILVSKKTSLLDPLLTLFQTQLHTSHILHSKNAIM
jgi:hypothetical protein